MIDLHIHSNHSDGEYSVSEILETVYKSGVKTFSITDHNTVNAYLEIREKKLMDKYDMKLIPGVEINVKYKDISFEVLGYNIDIDKMKSYLDENYNLKDKMEEEFNILYNNLVNNGLKLDGCTFNKDTDWSSYSLYNAVKSNIENKVLIGEEMWNSRQLLFRNICSNKDFFLYTDLSSLYLNINDVVKMIRSCGGKVFIAHLFVYGFSNHLELLDELVKSNLIDGVECYYSAFTKEQNNTLVDYCKNNNLLISGGSDYHGSIRPYKIGYGLGDLGIDEELIFDK